MLKHMILLLLMLTGAIHMKILQQSINKVIQKSIKSSPIFNTQTKQQVQSNHKQQQRQKISKSHNQLSLKDIYSLRQTFPLKQAYCLQKDNIFQYFKCMFDIFWESKVWKIMRCIFFIFIGVMFPPLIIVAIIIEYVRKGAEKDFFQF